MFQDSSVISFTFFANDKYFLFFQPLVVGLETEAIVLAPIYSHVAFAADCGLNIHG